MSLDEQLWVLDKSETFALYRWLTQAETNSTGNESAM
jgi:hypothetical protein